MDYSKFGVRLYLVNPLSYFKVNIRLCVDNCKMQSSRACGCFQWHDSSVHTRSKVIIVGLSRKISNSKTKLIRRKGRAKKMFVMVVIVNVVFVISLYHYVCGNCNAFKQH